MGLTSALLTAAIAFSAPLLAQDGEALMKKSDCFSCHQVTRKIVGPSYVDVAKKYKGAKASTVGMLVKKVKDGGSGNWGAIPMTGHPILSDADIEVMVRWVLAQGGAAKPAAAAQAPAAAATPAPVAKAVAGNQDKAGTSAATPAPRKKKKKSHAVNKHMAAGHAPELKFDTDEHIRQAMVSQDCYGCHSGLRRDNMAEDMPWPSFAQIEKKYSRSRPAEALVKKVRVNEGKPAWGSVPHPRYEHLSEAQVAKMNDFILSGAHAQGAAAAVDPGAMSAEDWMRKASDCFSCHSVNNKVIGPSYKDVAKKYSGASGPQVQALVKKVKEGGSGVWGSVPMTAHPGAPEAQLEKAVRWILEQGK